MKYKKIPFQKMRLAWFSLVCAYKASRADTKDEGMAYAFISGISETCIKMISEGNGEQAAEIIGTIQFGDEFLKRFTDKQR